MCSRGKKIVNMVQKSTDDEVAGCASEESNISSDPRSLPDNVDLDFFEDSDDSVKDPDFEPKLKASAHYLNDSFNFSTTSEEVSNDSQQVLFADDSFNAPSTSVEVDKNYQGRDLTKVCRDIGRKIKGDTRIKRNERKEKRNSGKSYETFKGKLVREKTLKELNMCRNRCIEKFSHETRQHIFTSFWSMNNYNRRVQYISDLIEIKDKKTTRIRVGDVTKQRFRQCTVVYYLQVNGSNLCICKTCFLKTFDVSNKFIETVLNKKRSVISGIISLDQRGSHSNMSKISDREIENARNHILSIPTYESHYSRRDSNKKYLPSHYTLASLYEAYKLTNPQKPVNRKRYESIFHELNISIKKIKKDTCSTCDKLAMKIKMAEEKTLLQEELAKHHVDADLGYTSKSVDKEQSKNDATKKTITFDLQQCLPTPDVKNSVAFYKRQLWTYDLTVHDCDNSQAYCYLWHEAMAKRGGNEIGSCLYQFLTNDLDDNVNHITMYSDCCGGQNKNSHISAMCMVAIQDSPNLQVIDHKFLISGHTHMECDTDHSLIEKQKKRFNGQIEHPHDWAQLIRQTGKKKPFIVQELEVDNFYNFSGLLNGSLINRKTNTDGKRINWRDFRWLRYEKGKKVVLYKTTFDKDDPFKVIDFERRGKKVDILKPAKAYKGPIPISVEKKQHIMDLLPFISNSLRDFYRNLITEDVVDTLSDTDEEEN